MARRVLGLDLGTRTGYAILDRSGYRNHGTWDCSFRRNVDSPNVRLEKFERFLSDVLIIEDVKVWYEIVRRHNGVQAAHVYGAMKVKMMEVCERFDVSFEGVDVGTWKKAFVGKGNAGKEMVFARAYNTGYAVTGEDEADAIGIALYGRDR